MELGSFSGEKIDRDGAMKGTENGTFVRIGIINSEETGKSTVHTIYRGIRKSTNDPAPLIFSDMGGVFLFQ